MDTKPIKVFCIGFNKTGTKSLHDVFTHQLKLNSIHSPKWTDWTISLEKNRLDQYQAFCDGECAELSILKKWYPDALYILNTRPLSDWLVSRHKSVERSKFVVNWMLTKYIPLRFISKMINKFILDNSDKAMLRWVTVRNAYHQHVIQGIDKEKLLVLDIADANAGETLAAFLGVDQSLSIAAKNQNGAHLKSGKIFDAIGQQLDTTLSKIAVDNFITQHSLKPHSDETLIFNDKLAEFNSKLGGQSELGGFRKWTLRWLVTRRTKQVSFFTKYILDIWIKLVRSEKNFKYYTPVSKFGAGAK